MQKCKDLEALKRAPLKGFTLLKKGSRVPPREFESPFVFI